jgi:hypothetical protein
LWRFFGFYGMLERKRSVLLAYLAFTAFTACMDLVRILVYYEYISSVLLGLSDESRILLYDVDFLWFVGQDSVGCLWLLVVEKHSASK